MTQTCDPNSLPVALDLLDLQIAEEVRAYVHNDCPLLQPLEGKVENMGSFYIMMTSSNGNIFRITGPLWGEPVDSPHKGQWRGALVFSLICAWTNGWDNRNAGDLRRHRAHYDVTVMWIG